MSTPKLLCLQESSQLSVRPARSDFDRNYVEKVLDGQDPLNLRKVERLSSSHDLVPARIPGIDVDAPFLGLFEDRLILGSHA